MIKEIGEGANCGRDGEADPSALLNEGAVRDWKCRTAAPILRFFPTGSAVRFRGQAERLSADGLARIRPGEGGANFLPMEPFAVEIGFTDISRRSGLAPFREATI